MEATRRRCKYCSRTLLAITRGPKHGVFRKHGAAMVCPYCDKIQVRT